MKNARRANIPPRIHHRKIDFLYRHPTHKSLYETRHAKGRLARRPAGRRLARPRARPTMPTGIATRLQQALDDWNFIAPQLQDLYDDAEPRQGAPRLPVRARRSAWRRCRAPTSGPTARPTSTTSSWCARRATPKCPRASTTDPLMYQGGSDDFLGPRDDIVVRRARSAASTSRPRSPSITGDVPMGATPEQALEGIRLRDAGQRRVAAQPDPGRAGQGLRLLPEQAGDRVQPGGGDARRTRRRLARRPRAPDRCSAPGTAARSASRDAGAEMTFHFGQLIAHVCKTRNVRAGCIVGSRHGHRNKDCGSAATRCIAEKRCLETIEDGAPQTDS